MQGERINRGVYMVVDKLTDQVQLLLSIIAFTIHTREELVHVHKQ